MIPWDLEGIPLLIKTDSWAGSDEYIGLRIYDKDGSEICAVQITFSSPMQYFIGHCLGMTDLQPPEEEDKIWKFTKTKTAIIIICNGVEVLNYLFADSSDSKCVPQWGGDVVEQIKFSSIHDTASNFYRAGMTSLTKVEKLYNVPTLSNELTVFPFSTRVSCIYC